MRTITKRQLIATVATRFQDAYLRRDTWLPTPTGVDTRQVHAQLAALPPDASEADVLAITGDDRWTANLCDECGDDVPVTVLFAEEISHSTDTVTLCPACLSAGLELVRTA